MAKTNAKNRDLTEDLKKQSEAVKQSAAKEEGANGGGENGNGQEVTVAGGEKIQTVYQYLEKMKPQIVKTLPKHLDADKLARDAFTYIRKNPKLLECSMSSLMGSVMTAAQLGLQPSLLGHCYIVPYWNGKNNRLEANFMLGYRGMIDLARRSGEIESVRAILVYEQDEFELELGLDPTIVHRPVLRGKRGDLVGVYGIAKFKGGGHHFEYMSIEDVEERRQRSQTPNAGPWKTDYEEMVKKTIIRYLFKYLPVSIEAQRATIVDEQPQNLEEAVESEDLIDIGPGYGIDEDEEEEAVDPAGASETGNN